MRLFGHDREYPPTADDTQAFFDRLDHLQDGQLLELDALWHGIPGTQRDVAWAEVRRVAREQGLDWWLEEVTGAAQRWGTGDARPYLFSSALDEPSSDIRHQAAPAIVDAAMAIAFEPYLAPETHDTLLSPFEAAVGES